jgi:hypothetical protein
MSLLSAAHRIPHTAYPIPHTARPTPFVHRIRQLAEQVEFNVKIPPGTFFIFFYFPVVKMICNLRFARNWAFGRNY